MFWTDDLNAIATDDVPGRIPAAARSYIEYDSQGKFLAELVDRDDNGTIDEGFSQVWLDETRLARVDGVYGRVERWEYDEMDRLAEYHSEAFLSRGRSQLSEWSCP